MIDTAGRDHRPDVRRIGRADVRVALAAVRAALRVGRAVRRALGRDARPDDGAGAGRVRRARRERGTEREADRTPRRRADRRHVAEAALDDDRLRAGSGSSPRRRC